MLLRTFVLALFLVAVGAKADIYQCTQPDGVPQYTNVLPKPKPANCKLIVQTPDAPASPATPAPAAPRSSTKSAPGPSPANFPKVDRETQQNRDSQRRRILEQELTNEQKLLEQAKKDLAEQESVRLGTERNYQKMLDRLEPYQKKVKLHEDNIASLRKEIGNLR